MPNDLRAFVSRFNNSFLNRLTDSKHSVELPVKISFVEDGRDISELRERHTGKLKRHAPQPTVSGYTQDLSRSGISFVVPFIRLGADYLVSEKTLCIELDLPNGTVHLQAMAQSYQPIEEGGLVTNYLVGAKITKIELAHAKTFENFFVDQSSQSSQTIRLSPQTSKVSSFLGLW